jgi:membrane protein DedA with SNARE-associated domain
MLKFYKKNLGAVFTSIYLALILVLIILIPISKGLSFLPLLALTEPWHYLIFKTSWNQPNFWISLSVILIAALLNAGILYLIGYAINRLFAALMKRLNKNNRSLP